MIDEYKDTFLPIKRKQQHHIGKLDRILTMKLIHDLREERTPNSQSLIRHTPQQSQSYCYWAQLQTHIK